MRSPSIRYPIIGVLAVAAMLLCSAGSASAQVPPVLRNALSPGLHFSPDGIGLTLDLPANEGGIIHNVRIMADPYGLMTGSDDIPGVKGVYILKHVVKTVRSQKGYLYRITAGPGIMGGYVRDKGKPFGPVAGICGNVGMDLLLKKQVTISFGITTELGVHMDYRNRYNSRITLYKNGLLGTVYPSVSVKHRFR
ncbi:MAG: hypothetical protein II730_12000 [Bacteroidales bacterium]|nr:hypothetical protein [Bacteroidales bacterium]